MEHIYLKTIIEILKNQLIILFIRSLYNHNIVKKNVLEKTNKWINKNAWRRESCWRDGDFATIWKGGHESVGVSGRVVFISVWCFLIAISKRAGRISGTRRNLGLRARRLDDAITILHCVLNTKNAKNFVEKPNDKIGNLSGRKPCVLFVLDPVQLTSETSNVIVPAVCLFSMTPNAWARANTNLSYGTCRSYYYRIDRQTSSHVVTTPCCWYARTTQSLVKLPRD